MSRKAAPNTAGSESRNENSAASLCAIPDKSPVVMVVPDLDMPGIIATAWETPTAIAFCSVTVEKRGSSSTGTWEATVLLGVPNDLDRYNMQPVTINPAEAAIVDEKQASIFSSNARPTMPAGIEAAITYATSDRLRFLSTSDPGKNSPLRIE